MAQAQGSNRKTSQQEKKKDSTIKLNVFTLTPKPTTSPMVTPPNDPTLLKHFWDMGLGFVFCRLDLA